MKGSLESWLLERGVIMLTKEELINFEEDIAQEFNDAKIKAPVHLYYGNEDAIIKVFESVEKEDWIFCSWRSHYQCLLKGVPPEKLKQKIMEGKSISLSFAEYNVFSSGIVTGSVPIALGVALDIKRRGGENKVFCFMGEMTSETGVAHECIKYAMNHELPIHFVIEDNGKSVCTDTRKTWNQDKLTFEGVNNEYITYYKYETKWPHAGAGTRVQF